MQLYGSKLYEMQLYETKLYEIQSYESKLYEMLLSHTPECPPPYYTTSEMKRILNIIDNLNLSTCTRK